MSNLPAIMPSNKDIQEMARLRQILNGGSNLPVQHEVQAQYTGGSDGVRRPLNESQYTPPPAHGFAGREDVDAMKSILERLNAVNESTESAPSYSAPQTLNEVTHSSSQTGYKVSVMLSEDASGKETSNHSVIAPNGSAVISGLVLSESAKAVMKFLNKGLNLNSAKVEEVIDLDESYSRNKILVAQSRSRYQRSIELGETAAAQVFKNRFETTRAQALDAHDQIKSILESIR